jgi:chemotaxis family two-component system response regulator Rcp1
MRRAVWLIWSGGFESPPGSAMSLPPRPIHLLLVEDDSADARLFVEAVKRFDRPTEIYRVATGAEALARLQESATGSAPRPDGIILDLNLPRMDGRQFLTELRSQEPFRQIPVIILTASPADSDVLHAFDFHAAGYLRKPVEAATLDQVLKRLGSPRTPAPPSGASVPP